MNQFILLIIGAVSLAIGSILGYFARQSIARRDWKTIEAKIQKRIQKAKEEASQIFEEARKERDGKRRELLKTEEILLRRESILDRKISGFEIEQKEFREKVEKLKRIKEDLENLRTEALENLERIAGLNKEKAKTELFTNLEKEYQKEILEKMRKLEAEGEESFEKRAKEILATSIQKYALSQVQEITTSTISLPNEEIKGRIIGKEGRNIRTLERLTGIEIVVDETPETAVISGFDPIRREIAKSALEKLIKDGRIQPARIEEKVEEAKKEINSKIKEAGEAAIYELGLVGLDPRLIHLLGRLKFRTSYGQNVLLHSIEVAYLAEALADEIGANSLICKKAGLFHDIGKAVDQQIEGSHVNIGIKILEKFGGEPEVIKAMKSHHGEYPVESLEAILVQSADQISGARPGARKDTLENYLKRLSDLENIATSFPGVEKAWALQA
ncbi:ribonuclease Y, partial [bacterium]|nr:ribonuclease Y [bacterium]